MEIHIIVNFLQNTSFYVKQRKDIQVCIIMSMVNNDYLSEL